MTKSVRLDLAGDGPTHCYYAREELLDRRVVAIDYQTGSIPKWIEERGEYLGDTPTENSAVTFWRMPSELLAVQATLSTTVVDKHLVI